MQCPRCQHDNPPQSSFCLECGSHVTLTCGACGADLPSGSRFCNHCGTTVHPSAAARPRFSSPEAYTPRHLAEKILTSRRALEGERKHVTVLFADLKGSMELLADRDPEEARRLLDPVLERMMEAVHHYEGTVNQVMGDGIMALFGAPVAHEDHAVRACYAALRMQESVNRYADEARRAHGVTVQIRVGLNSGEVVVRAIGSDLHMDYTAVGETTHLAARMEQAARPGTALIAPATLDLVEGLVAVTSLGPVAVKGRRLPVEAYELTGIGPARTRLQAAARRGFTPFVGRDAEIAGLHRSLEQAGAGHGQVVAIVGEAGVGKSRLHWEFTRSPHANGWLVLRGRSISYARGTPYLPVIELLKSYLRIQERDDARVVRERVADQLRTLDRTLEALLTPLLALFDVPVDDAAWNALDPPQRRQRIVDAVKRLLLRESEVQPVLLVFADLQWMDSESQAVLDAVIDSLPTARILLLISYRPEYQHGWGRKAYYTRLEIEPLPPASAEELLTGLLGQDGTLESLKRTLMERTGGNPFFLEESVQTLVESKMLVGDRGAYRMTKAPEVWPIPATTQAIVAARIDRLPPEEKALLQAASVIGQDVPLALLRSIVDVSERNLRLALADLETAEFLYETSLFPDLEYTFKQTLTHEVAYASMLQDRRRALHARIMEALESALPRSSDRAGRASGSPCLPGRGVAESRHVPPAGRRQGTGPFGLPRGGEPLRTGTDGLAAPARDARDNRARDRSSARPSPVALPAERAHDGLEVSRGSRRVGQNARRSATTRMGVGVYEWPSLAHRRSRHRRAPVCGDGRGHRVNVSATFPSRSPLTTTLPPPRTFRATIARRSMSAGDSCSRYTTRRAVTGSASRSFRRWCLVRTWPARSPNAACSTRETLMDNTRSGSPKRSITRSASSWHVSISRI